MSEISLFLKVYITPLDFQSSSWLLKSTGQTGLTESVVTAEVCSIRGGRFVEDSNAVSVNHVCGTCALLVLPIQMRRSVII